MRAHLTARLTRAALMGAAVAVALAERLRTELRKARGARPRLIWGPLPIINIKYWSEAMRSAGYESRTCVREVYAIYSRDDFDVHRGDFLGGRPRLEPFRDLAFFVWALRHGDVFFRFFDGGFLRFTAYEAWEHRLLKLAGKRMIASPYGADVAVDGHLEGLESKLYADYPVLAEMTDVIEAQVLKTADEADLIIRNWQIGFLPRHDVVWLNQLAIDIASWDASGEDSGFDGTDGAVTVLHAPNHKNIKGTVHFERAVDQLRSEGLQVDFEVVQGRPNHEVKPAVRAADVIADQLLLPGYAMAAVEAMAVGKPVMDNISGLDAELLATEAGRACPAVDTNAENVVDVLRGLVTDPGLRRELGAAGRIYVERFHAYPVVAATFEVLIDHVWRGSPLPDSLLPRGD